MGLLFQEHANSEPHKFRLMVLPEKQFSSCSPNQTKSVKAAAHVSG